MVEGLIPDLRALRTDGDGAALFFKAVILGARICNLVVTI